MIEYLKGDLTELTPTTATIECHGVGYLTHISLYTYTAIQNRPHVKLYVHEAIRDDAYQLYGFVDKRERELFLQLISSCTSSRCLVLEAMRHVPYYRLTIQTSCVR